MHASTSNRIEERNSSYMKISKSSPGSRNEFAVSLRKSKRLKYSIDFRSIVANPAPSPLLDLPSFSIEKICNSLLKVTSDNLITTLSTISEICKGKNAFKLLDHPEILLQINSLVAVITSDDTLCLILEIWCTLFSGKTSYIQKVLNLISYDAILSMISIRNPRSTKLAIQCLANIAGDCKEFRQQILIIKIEGFIISFLYTCSDKGCMKAAAYFFANISREQSAINYESFENILRGIKILLRYEINEIYYYCLFALGNLCRNNPKRIQALVNLDVLDKVISLTRDSSLNIRGEALKLVGDVSFGDIGHVMCLLDNNVLDCLKNTMDQSSSNMKKETLYIISNIIAGGIYCLDSVLKHPIMIDIIESLNYHELDVTKEASFVFFNISQLGVFTHFQKIATPELFLGLKQALQIREPSALKNFLSFIKCVIISYRDANNFEIYELLESSGCITQIQIYQRHMNTGIFNLVSEILEFFISSEDPIDLDVPMKYNL